MHIVPLLFSLQLIAAEISPIQAGFAKKSILLNYLQTHLSIPRASNLQKENVRKFLENKFISLGLITSYQDVTDHESKVVFNKFSLIHLLLFDLTLLVHKKVHFFLLLKSR